MPVQASKTSMGKYKNTHASVSISVVPWSQNEWTSGLGQMATFVAIRLFKYKFLLMRKSRSYKSTLYECVCETFFTSVRGFAQCSSWKKTSALVLIDPSQFIHYLPLPDKLVDRSHHFSIHVLVWLDDVEFSATRSHRFQLRNHPIPSHLKPPSRSFQSIMLPCIIISSKKQPNPLITFPNLHIKSRRQITWPAPDPASGVTIKGKNCSLCSI